MGAKCLLCRCFINQVLWVNPSVITETHTLNSATATFPRMFFMQVKRQQVRFDREANYLICRDEAGPLPLSAADFPQPCAPPNASFGPYEFRQRVCESEKAFIERQRRWCVEHPGNDARLQAILAWQAWAAQWPALHKVNQATISALVSHMFKPKVLKHGAAPRDIIGSDCTDDDLACWCPTLSIVTDGTSVTFDFMRKVRALLAGSVWGGESGDWAVC